MDGDYDSGDDLLGDVNPDGRAMPQKRNREDSSDDEGRLRKVTKTNSFSLKLARKILYQRFGYKDFRHEQEAAIEAILRGRNTLVIFPTGAGKSLCYQVRHTLHTIYASSL